ncbi:MAG TPA: hypothetical protein VM573_08770 [Actinomycetota bacterium]|jgi:hypothetical protein|nr:hypothetical protein [Actinomycetota bacterium]
MRDRLFRITDKEMTWTRAILLGSLIWILLIIGTGQVPSFIIYWIDQNVASVIDFSKNIPGVNDEGLNPKQIQIVRDLIANGVQMGFLIVLLAFAYFWQKSKQKRLGLRGLQDPVKGYMSGK